MAKIMKRFAKDESGATAIEYGLIAALVSVVIIGALQILGTNLNATFTSVSGALTTYVSSWRRPRLRPGLSAFAMSPMIAFVCLMMFPLLMAYAAASDLLTMTIPNVLSLALLGGFVVLAVSSGLGLHAILMNVAAFAVVLAATFAMFAFGWIGGGDAKLAAATALWFGFETLPAYLVVAALAGGLLTAAIVLFRLGPLPRFASRWAWLQRLHDPKGGVPYGIALAAGALVVYPHSQLWQLFGQ